MRRCGISGPLLPKNCQLMKYPDCPFESRDLTYLESIRANEREFHLYRWARGPWKLKLPKLARTHGRKVHRYSSTFIGAGQASLRDATLFLCPYPALKRRALFISPSETHMRKYGE